MTPEHPEDLLPGYALTALDQSERVEVERHLNVCVGCQAATQENRAYVAQLAFGVPLRQPPAELKESLMQRIAAEAAASPVDATTGQIRRLPRWLMATTILPWVGVAGLVAALLAALQNQPASALTVASLSGPHGAYGQLAMAPNGSSAVLMLTRLPALPKGHTYICWLERNGVMERAGSFSLLPHSDDAEMVLHPPHPMNSYSLLSITMEADTRLDHPTGTLLATGHL